MVGASDGGAPKGAANANRKALPDSGLRGETASDVRAGTRSSDEDEETYRKESSLAAATAAAGRAAPQQPILTSGIVSVVSEEDEEGAEETRVQEQPPNFAAIERAFVPVGTVDIDPDTNRRPKVGAGDTYDEDESVTRLGAPVEPYAGDDSVTTEGRPVARPRPIPPADDTESVTKRKLARGALPKLTSAEDDDSSVRETAIIVSPVATEERPIALSPSIFPRNVVGGMRVGAGVAAARAEILEPLSDSGLRLTHEDVAAGERGTLGLDRPPVARPEPGLPGRSVPPPARLPQDLSPPVYPGGPGFALPNANAHVAATSGDPPFADADGPRYDARVIIVALVSFAVPFGLFLYLYYLFDQSQGSSDAASPSVVVSSETTPRDDTPPRPKAPKPASQPASESRHRR